MIFIDNPTRNISAVMSASANTTNPTFVASYEDGCDCQCCTYNNDGSLNGSTPVVLVSSPVVGIKRQLKYLSIYNSDTAPVIISIKYIDTVTIVILKVSLSVGYSIIYDSQNGWQVLTNTGAILTATSGASGGYYQIIESNGTPEPQEDALNFLSAFTVADNSGNGSTDISLANTGVSAGTYGDSTHVVQISINAAGQITAATNIAVGGGTVTTVSVVTNQGVSGTVANPTTTPAITLSLGALTGITSLNGLVITANTGVITTGTWNGTKISAQFGGTNQDSSSSTGIAQVLSGVWSFSSALANGTTATTQAAGDNTTKIATDAFVTTAINNAISGVNPAIAVQAATTLASDTSSYTYNNGVSGIGATLTGTTNVAFICDGFTFTTLGQRVLVKNDTQSPSGAYNGIYYVTQLQTALLPPILTRALDYDQPSDINNTGAIPVVNGTVNSSTSWILTSTVNTVGTDPLTYTQFTLNPTKIFTTAGTGLTGTGTNIVALATALPNGQTATTQALNDNSNKVATDAFVQNQIAAIPSPAFVTMSACLFFTNN